MAEETTDPTEDDINYADPEDEATFWYTIDDDGTLLELILDDGDGMYVRDGADWVPANDDEKYPDVYDRVMEQIAPDKVLDATKDWDSQTLSKTVDDVANWLATTK